MKKREAILYLRSFYQVLYRRRSFAGPLATVAREKIIVPYFKETKKTENDNYPCILNGSMIANCPV